MSRRHLINSSDVFVIKGFTVVNHDTTTLTVPVFGRIDR